MIESIQNIKDINELLKAVTLNSGSDLHLSSGLEPMIRKDGELSKVSNQALSNDDMLEILKEITSEEQRKAFEAENDLDFAIQLDDTCRFRVNFFKQNRGISGVFRHIPIEIKSIEEIGAPPVIRELTKLENGLILVTGPTGSGKSTTLATMLNIINQERAGHLITIEDPIEFIHFSNKCLVNQREVGMHVKSFSRALREALREDPDYILIGEMRDLETIQLALTAAETGHLVFASLHTSGATKTISRIIDVFPANQQGQVRSMLADSIQAIISQTLCKKKTGGRTAAFEILLGTPAVRNLIREGKNHQLTTIIQTSQKRGMQTLEAHLNKLLSNGIITRDVFDKKINSIPQ